MKFFIPLLLSVTPAVLLLVALAIREWRRCSLRRSRLYDASFACAHERGEFNARQRDLALWNAQFRPSDDKPVFARESRESRKERLAFREYVHTDPLTDENVVKCGLMKKVVLPS